MSAGLVVLLLVAAGAAAPWLLPGDPNEISDAVLIPPSLGHPFGTDDLGRDVLAGIVYGIRVSVTVGVLSAAASLLLGGCIGAVAGYRGGRLDTVIMRVSEIFQVIPTFILAAVIAALSGPGLWQIIVVVAALSWPQTARVMRGEVIRIKQLDYVDAGALPRHRRARDPAAGSAAECGRPRAGGRHADRGNRDSARGVAELPRPQQPGRGELGAHAEQRPALPVPRLVALRLPGLAIVVTVLAFNLLGDAVAAALDPGPAR
ncbi:MAG: ABC transporter permease [Acetobacteraceae bacterium]